MINFYIISFFCSLAGLIALNLRMVKFLKELEVDYEFNITPGEMKGYLLLISIPLLNTLVAVLFGMYVLSDKLMLDYINRRVIKDEWCFYTTRESRGWC